MSPKRLSWLYQPKQPVRTEMSSHRSNTDDFFVEFISKFVKWTFYIIVGGIAAIVLMYVLVLIYYSAAAIIGA
jgi:hypothetical protein